MVETGEERYYTTPHLHIRGKVVACGRDSDGLWQPLSRREHRTREPSDEDDVERATDPGDIARICEALSEPLSRSTIAIKAGMSQLCVNRLIPRMLREGTVRAVSISGPRGQSYTAYELT